MVVVATLLLLGVQIPLLVAVLLVWAVPLVILGLLVVLVLLGLLQEPLQEWDQVEE
jgi:fatty acid desaturase